MRKMIVSDFDDTIYINKTISEDNIKAINNFRKNENIFVIASGSSYTALKRKIGNQRLTYDYLITDHGALIFKNDKAIFSEIIPAKIVEDIYSKFCLNKRKWNNNDGKGYFLSTAKEGLLFDVSENITKMHLDFEKEKELDEAITYLNEKYGNIINCYKLLYHNDVEIISKNASKLIAIEIVRKENKIDKKDVYTVGDGNSDLEMIKEYNGYAMNNAVDKVKKASKTIVLSVSEMISMVLKNQ